MTASARPPEPQMTEAGGGERAAGSDQGGIGDEDRQIDAVNQAPHMEPRADALMLLRRALDHALRTRDPIGISALRSALSAISNAEAVSAAPGVARPTSPHIAGAAAGVYGGEARRRDLSAAEVDQIVQAEIDERLQAAGDYDRAGRAARAERLRAEASVLASALRPQTGMPPPARIEGDGSRFGR